MDTLPEEKIVPTSTTIPTTPNTNVTTTNNIDESTEVGYKRVYPDWKPSKTLEQTDVVGTIQAIAGK